MRAILLASVAAVVMPRAFMSEAVETVMVTSKDWKDPVAVNKSDYDADQAEGGEKRFTLHKSATAEQAVAAAGEVQVPVADGLQIPPAPSAPLIGTPVAPTTANADTLFITKIGNSKKIFVVRADGSKVEDMKDIDPKGYDTEELAKAAVWAAKKQPHEQGSGALGTHVGGIAAAPVSDIPAATDKPQS
jgi:hypothetical protein